MKEKRLLQFATVVLIVYLFFHIGKHNGVEHGRPDVVEVAIHKTGDQKRYHGNEWEHLFPGEALEEQTKGLNPVETVSQNTHSTARCQQLNNGVVPSGREERDKIRIFCPGKQGIMPPKTGFSKNCSKPAA